MKKKLQVTNVVLSKPERKVGKRLSDEVQKCIFEYYNDDDKNRAMPGKNYCIFTIYTNAEYVRVL